MKQKHPIPKSFVEVIGLWPNSELLAKGLGEKAVTVRAWKNRTKNIPPRVWTKLAALAAQDNLPVTLDLLSRLASVKHPRKISRGEAA